MGSNPTTAWHEPSDTFLRRHVGSGEKEIAAMLHTLGVPSLDKLIDQAVPESIRLRRDLNLPEPLAESAVIERLREIAERNQVFESYIGMGYHPTITPAVIQRNILENPGWYTAYTPYQAEISQGRMEALLNFQTMICDLTGMQIANASLLDEGTAAAEAMAMCWGMRSSENARRFFIAAECHPQTIEVVRTRAEPLEIEVHVAPFAETALDESYFAALLQYPGTNGEVPVLDGWITRAHAAQVRVIVATDPLALTVLRPPGEFGADVVVGSAQRFGVPMGYGGPHAGFLATRDEFKRQMPGRLIGVSKDSHGNPAYRLSLQTREQHIRRDKATSNICTAQVLLAVMASMYAVYHGPQGLIEIAHRILGLTNLLAQGLRHFGFDVENAHAFDTVTVQLSPEAADHLRVAAEADGINLRYWGDGRVSISLHERTRLHHVVRLLWLFDIEPLAAEEFVSQARFPEEALAPESRRTSSFLTHPVFNTHHTETEMLRYIRQLEARDISLTTSMIPLGSCTMKLNATTEMWAVTWREFAELHPFAPRDQARGYEELATELSRWLAEITGFAAVSLQPNAGSQGEYAGLLAIRAYHRSRGEAQRRICLIPLSAHGTNPASAVMAGMQVVPVACDADGNIDLADLEQKAEKHRDQLAALMVTYPSTHGVFEEGIGAACRLIHERGGQVYMDGANLNAQVGLCRPGDIGADVCHLNLHKTFCIPHGGGGPGVGPIGVAQHLVPFLPGHSVQSPAGAGSGGAISAAPYGSALILTIPWTYIAMLGAQGLRHATELAILNANYMAKRLSRVFPVLYRGKGGWVAHECILDFRDWKTRAGIEVEDVAKRLMDYGFHAPTMSWPVPGTLMIEPTESESKEEMDRFCDAMESIHAEMLAVQHADGPLKENNPLKHAPHTASAVTATEWNRPYSREQAAFPLPYLRRSKVWPYVGRVDNVYGDRNLFCSCVPIQTHLE